MTSHSQMELDTALARLSQIYPDLRFGQLIEMVALLAVDESPENPRDIEDARLLRTAVAHLSNRLSQLGGERASVSTSVPAARRELFDLFRELQSRHPSWRFGQLASTVADWSAVSLYDAEDEQLLAAGRRHLAGNGKVP